MGGLKRKDVGISKQYVYQTSSIKILSELSSSCSYGCWIYNYICNQYLSPLKL